MNDLLSGILANQQPADDTLYCNPRFKRELLSSIDGFNSHTRADGVRICGLTIVTHELFEYPIVCEKGAVFDLAREYKD